MNITDNAIAQAKVAGLAGQPSTILYHWTEFQKYADLEGISLEHEDDWFEWWRIWVAAVVAERNDPCKEANRG